VEEAIVETPPPEETIWEGSPSHWIRFGTYCSSALLAVALLAGYVYLSFIGGAALLGAWAATAGLVLAAALVIPLFFVLRAIIVVRCTRYKLTSERILSSTGVFARKTENLELYRVDDLKVYQPLFLRMVGRGTLSVTTSDRSDPVLLLVALPNVHALLDTMRKHIEACRDRKRTRVLDMGIE
jgi:uncharacterized membrane protein YdbT with pleckstrin-like domain